ncbi:MAG: biopolymer transporter ExbD [Gemmatimonadota bacterium]|jgi:biopolymer transport protein ExbD/biopolymer transport protein TolR
MTHGRRNGGRSDLPLNADINVTSLVDVAFTLLVIFIITAPILQGGIEVSVPKADVQPLTARDKPFFVTVTQQGQIFIEDKPTTVSAFEESFPQLAKAGNLEHVYLRADSMAMYGPVLKVIATLARTDVKWSLVGEPYSGSGN